MICIEGKAALIALPTFCNVPVRALQAWSALKFVQQQVEAAQLDKKNIQSERQGGFGFDPTHS